MEFTLAEAERIDLAKKKVAEKLSKPEELDRLEQYRRKVSRKKATVESQLRNAVQTQLEGVQTGLENLKEAKKAVMQIKESMAYVEDVYRQNGAVLSDVVRPIREVNKKHQQLRTTNEHINNIFNVPDVVADTRELIKEGKLLEAHQNLSKLEHTRDELLMQLYQGDDAYVDKNTSLHHYFQDLMGLSDAMGQSLWLTLTQATKLIHQSPATVVTALRIIEREERIDKMLEGTLELKGIPASQIPGRPKSWKAKCFEILESSISNKFEELDTNLQLRMESKEWLSDLLSEVAKTCYQDLQVIVTGGDKCFPPDYNILTFFVRQYHKGLVNVVSKLIDMGLNARDIILLMVWIGDVKTSFAEMLTIDLVRAGPIIKPNIEQELLKTCHGQVEMNVRELMANMVKAEADDWRSVKPPESDVKGDFYTPIGINLFQIVNQNISALAPLGVATKKKILSICLESMLDFQKKYRDAINSFYTETKNGQSGQKQKDRDQRETVQPAMFFTFYIIAIANSCKSCVDFTEQLKRRFSVEFNEVTLAKEKEVNFKKAADEFDAIGFHCCNILLDVAFSDLRPVLSGLMTRDAWFSRSLDLVRKVEGTIVDYNGDFAKLKPSYHTYVILECQQRVFESYLQSLLSKRMVLKKDKEREKAGDTIIEEVRKLSAMFLRLSHACNPKYTHVIEVMAEVIKSKPDFLPLEISSLASKHREVKLGHVVALLAMRGDLNKAQATKMLESTVLYRQQEGEEENSSNTGGGGGGGGGGGVGRGRKERNVLRNITVKNPWSLLK